LRQLTGDNEITGSSSEGNSQAGEILMAQGLAANAPFSDSVKSRAMRPTSRCITALLVAVGTGFAVSATIGAPIAVAQVCEIEGQVKIDGQCRNVIGDPVPTDDAKIVCTQSGHCHVSEKE
jgi:hypothetical protein